MHRQRSPFWYLLPIFLGIIGGIIVYFGLKNTNKQKAKRALVIGIIISIPLFAWVSSQITFGSQNPFYIVAAKGIAEHGLIQLLLPLYEYVLDQNPNNLVNSSYQM